MPDCMAYICSAHEHIRTYIYNKFRWYNESGYKWGAERAVLLGYSLTGFYVIVFFRILHKTLLLLLFLKYINVYVNFYEMSLL